MKHKPTLDLSEKHYKPEHLEQVIYKTWKDQKAFAPDPSSNKKRFSVAIPPPNVTGRLHMGHALNNSVQDSPSQEQHQATKRMIRTLTESL